MAKKNVNFPEIKLVSKKEKKLFIECMKNDQDNISFDSWNSTVEKIENKFNKFAKKSLFQYIDLEKNEAKYFFILDDQLGKDGTNHIYYFKSTDDVSDMNQAISKFLKFLFDEKNIENIVLHVNSLDNDTLSILKHNKVMQFEGSLYYVSGINEKGEDEWSKLEISLKDMFVNIQTSNEETSKQSNEEVNEEQSVQNEDASENIETSSDTTKETFENNENTNDDNVEAKNDDQSLVQTSDEVIQESSNENVTEKPIDNSSEKQSFEENNYNESSENYESSNDEEKDGDIVENNDVDSSTINENTSSVEQETYDSANEDFVNVDLSDENVNIENNQEYEYEQNLDQENYQESHELENQEIQQQEYNEQLEKENLEKSQKWANEFYQLRGEDANGILSTKERFPQKEFEEYDPLDISKISYDLKSLSTLKIKSDNVGNNDYNATNFSTYEQARKNVLESLENLKKTNKKGHDSIDTIGVSKSKKEETLSERSNASVEEMKKRIDDLKEKINN